MMMSSLGAAFTYLGIFTSGILAHWWQTPTRWPRAASEGPSFEGLAAECLDRLDRIEPSVFGWRTIFLLALAFVAGALAAASASRLVAGRGVGGTPAAPSAAASIVFHQAVADAPVLAQAAPAVGAATPVDFTQLDLNTYVPVGRRPITSCL